MMKNFILISSFIFLFAISAQAQTECQSVEECRSQLSEAAKMINKLLDVNKASADVITAQKAEIEARKSLDAINAQIIEKQTARFNDAEKEIALLKKKAQRKVSILFGLIKITY